MGPRAIFRQTSSYAKVDGKKPIGVSDIKTLKRVASAFKPYKAQVILVLFAIIVTTLIGLINPLMIKYVFDDAIGKHNLNLLIFFVSLMFITPIIGGIINVGQSYLNNVIGQHVMRDFRNDLYSHLQMMSLDFFTSTKTGEMQSRLSNDIGGVQGVITDTATTVVSNISTVLSTIIAMLFISPTLTAVSLGLVPVFLWITSKVGHVRRSSNEETQKSLARLTSVMQETLSVSGIMLIKTYGRQEHVSTQFNDESEKLAQLQVRQQMVGRWFFMFIGTFFNIIPAIVYLIAGLEIIHSPLHPSISLGGIVAFTTLQSRLFFPIGQLLNVQVEIQGALALFDRIFEYLDMPIEISEKENPINLTPAEIKGDIVFDHVSFQYKGNHLEEHSRQPFGVEDISFHIKPGQLAALVGPSGSGKTTLTYLLSRLYDVDSGSVLIDGNDIRSLSLSTIEQMIGYVTQESFLFNTTIRENLLFAKPDAKEEEMIAAAKAAAIHDRIASLPEGYDTIVGERGYKLSGGEKQRLAIARVILKNPRVLILDEATSALDTHSERLIQASLEPLMEDRTTLAIAHRLSTILAADVILAVEDGMIVESGTHHELLTKGGLYAKLYNEQFAHMHVQARS